MNKEAAMIAERLKEIRVNAGLTQADITKVIGIPARTWQNWELGERQPSNWVFNLVENFFINNREEKKMEYRISIQELKAVSKVYSLLWKEEDGFTQAFDDVLEALSSCDITINTGLDTKQLIAWGIFGDDEAAVYVNSLAELTEEDMELELER